MKSPFPYWLKLARFPLLLRAPTALTDAREAGHPMTRRALERLISHYRARGMAEAAEQWEAAEH